MGRRGAPDASCLLDIALRARSRARFACEIQRRNYVVWSILEQGFWCGFRGIANLSIDLPKIKHFHSRDRFSPR
jgi:hypothetical protein